MATIKEIKEELAKIRELESPLLKEFEKDSRSGVQKEIEKRKKAIQAEMDENLRLEGMLRYEKDWPDLLLLRQSFFPKIVK